MAGEAMQTRPGDRDPFQIGYVDESYQFRAGRLVHVLGVVEPAAGADLVRVALRELPPKPQGRLHFTDEDDERRVAVAAAIGGLPLRCTAVVCGSETRVERARGLSVERLAWHVHRRVDRLVLESRSPRGDGHDASVLAGLWRRGIRLTCGFAGKEEPLLWAADVVAGATRLAFAGGDAAPLRALGAVDVVEF